MKAREFAVQLGLAKPGRGKMSAAAHAAIQAAIAEGKVFDDYSGGKTDRNGAANNSADSVKSRTETEPEAPVEIKSRPVMHDYSNVWGVDTRGRRPIKIAFAWCACCLVQIRYCSSATPRLPEWIGGETLTEEPTQEKMQQIFDNANSLV